MRTVYKIPIDQITVNNQIVDDEHILDIVDFIESGGKTPPITVRQTGIDQYRIVDGRHRLAAHKILGYKTIKAIKTL